MWGQVADDAPGKCAWSVVLNGMVQINTAARLSPKQENGVKMVRNRNCRDRPHFSSAWLRSPASYLVQAASRTRKLETTHEAGTRNAFGNLCCRRRHSLVHVRAGQAAEAEPRKTGLGNRPRRSKIASAFS